MTDTRKPDGTHRVAITGVGALSPAGVGVDALMGAVNEGRRCIAPITRFDTQGYPATLAAEIPSFDAQACGLTKKEARRFAPFVQYAIVAADEAMASSGLSMRDEDPTRVACVWGSGIDGLFEFEAGCKALHERGPKRVSPLFIPTMIENMAAGNLSIRYGMKGDCLSIVTACATGAHCVGEAYRLIRHGYADAALAGGSEESISPVCLAGFGNLGALCVSDDPDASAMPFDANRSGFVPGEGAGALVLESFEHAIARGARIIAEVAGFGSTGDAYHMTAPEPSGEGAVRAMRMALDEAGFEPGDVGHLNAHGTSTKANDAMEAAAVAALWGAGAQLPVTSVKGTVGHMMGAAGAIEAIVCALSAARGMVPPTAGTREIDSACPVNVVTGAPLSTGRQAVALSNSLGFGGHNASLALAPFED